MEEIICKQDIDVAEKDYVHGHFIRDSIFQLIKQDHPEFTRDCYIRQDVLNKYRQAHLAYLLRQVKGDVDKIDNEVLEAISKRSIISGNVEDTIEEHLTLGQRIADKVAQFGGSWTFIISFAVFLFLWMGVNVWFLTRPFDPYPFILLNLALSTLAAIQAPIIMMSQNRQEEKDRIRSINDYKVNLKSELEIKLLHEKIDHLILFQNRQILDHLEVQDDYLEEITQAISPESGKEN